MKLSELTGVKKYHNLTANELMNQVTNEYNLKLNTMGAFGYVLIANNEVYKVFDNDPAYLSYINFVIKNPNRHYPKILKAPKLLHAFYSRNHIEPNKFTVVKLEKLYPLTSETQLEFIEELIHHIDTKQNWVLIKPSYLINGDENVNNLTYSKLTKKYPWIFSFGLAYLRIKNSHAIHGSFDLHGDNIMQRQDGIPVIIDPVIDEDSYSFQRMRIKLKHDTTGPSYKK